MHPAGDLIHLSFAVQPLLARSALLQLGSIRVTLPEEVLVAEGGSVHCVLPVKSSFSLSHHLVDFLLDEGAFLRREDAPLLDAAPHPPGLLLPEVRAVVAVLALVVIGFPILALPALPAAVTRPVHEFIFVLVSVRSHGLELLPQVRVSASCHVGQKKNNKKQQYDRCAAKVQKRIRAEFQHRVKHSLV